MLILQGINAKLPYDHDTFVTKACTNATNAGAAAKAYQNHCAQQTSAADVASCNQKGVKFCNDIYLKC